MQLKPLTDMLDMVQGNNAALVDACRAWLTLAKDKNLIPHHNARADLESLQGGGAV